MSSARLPPAPTEPELLRPWQQDCLLAGLAAGQSLRSLCAKKQMPPLLTVLDWLGQDKAFADAFARSREAWAEALFDLLDEVSAQAAASTSAVEVSGLRLKSDNIKWKLARMNPRKYGERQQLDVSAKVELTQAQVDEKLKLLLRKASLPS